MAGFSIVTYTLPLLMLIATSYCATYRAGGTFGAESHLNLTSTGFGTLKSNRTANSGIGGVWNGSVYGAGYGNYDDRHGAAIASATKVVSLTPGDGLEDIKSGNTTYRSTFLFGDLAKRFWNTFFGDDSVTTAAPNE